MFLERRYSASKSHCSVKRVGVMSWEEDASLIGEAPRIGESPFLALISPGWLGQIVMLLTRALPIVIVPRVFCTRKANACEAEQLRVSLMINMHLTHAPDRNCYALCVAAAH